MTQFMKPITLPVLLQIAGLLHIGLIAAGLLMPKAVNLRAQLVSLPPFVRQLYWVYYSFIGLCLVGFGLITVTLSDSLASGQPLARAVCVLLSVFWTIRLVAATFVFDVSPYLTNRYWRLGYHATNVAFIYMPVVYAWAALKGGV